MRFLVTREERWELLKAWLAISLAFAILLGGGLSLSRSFLGRLLLAGLTVGVGFLAHELAHKVVAQRHGCRAEFRASNEMLLLAIVTSFFGLIIASPGAVLITGRPSLAERGRTSLAGPLANLALSALFTILLILSTPGGVLASLLSYGAVINAWLGLFNMIPFHGFDGAKVLAWSGGAYGATVALGVILALIHVPLGILA